MTPSAARPKRKLRSEALFLAAVMAVPAAMFALFPRQAAAFRPAGEPPRPAPSCEFVRLSPDAEYKAMEKIRAALSVRRDKIVSLTADLSLSTLPETPPEPIVSAGDAAKIPALPVSAADFIPFPPSLAAPEPDKIESAESAGRTDPFPREELLKININERL